MRYSNRHRAARTKAHAAKPDRSPDRPEFSGLKVLPAMKGDAGAGKRASAQ
jgi:hypothetical protein